MNEKRASLEIIAPSIDEAIEKGLNDLGLPRESVEVEVLDEGTRGLFGLGSRQARIRLKIKEEDQPDESKPAIAEPTPKPIETEAEPVPEPIEAAMQAAADVATATPAEKKTRKKTTSRRKVRAPRRRNATATA